MPKRANNSSTSAAKTSQTRGMTSAPPDRKAPVKAAPAAASAAVPAIKPAPARPSHEAIARRAREIWLSGTGGSDLQNWLQAEKELRAGR